MQEEDADGSGKISCGNAAFKTPFSEVESRNESKSHQPDGFAGSSL